MSLLLTLLATPVAYSFFEDIVEWRKRRSRRKAIDRGEAELANMDSQGHAHHPDFDHPLTAE